MDRLLPVYHSGPVGGIGEDRVRDRLQAAWLAAARVVQPLDERAGDEVGVGVAAGQGLVRRT